MYTHFKREERCEIAILLKRGYSVREIGYTLRRNPASVGREIARNRVNDRYDPQKASHKAYVRRKYAKYQGMKIREDPALEQYVREKLMRCWSPERIAGRLRRDTESKRSLHHTTIYKYLYSFFGQSFCRYLRYQHYRRKKRTRVKSLREVIKNRVFIDQRPTVINGRQRYGDFEGDTMGKPQRTQETLVAARERKSRYVIAVKVPQLKYAIEGFREIFRDIPARSLTLDSGPENARYPELELPTYFCHPYSAWEKGSIENAFGRIREFIPKKANLARYSAEDVRAIVDLINDTPMKCLGYRTPKEVFEEQFLNAGCCTSG